MSRPAQAPQAAAGWPTTLLLVAAAAFALPGLFDMDAFKAAAVALLAAAVLLPWMALAARSELRAWLGSAGGWLPLLAVALAVPAALGRPWSATTADRLLLVALTTLAGALGLRAARLAAAAHAAHAAAAHAGAADASGEDGGRLVAALQYATLVTAVVVLLQALGIEHRFTPETGDFLRR